MEDNKSTQNQEVEKQTASENTQKEENNTKEAYTFDDLLKDEELSKQVNAFADKRVTKALETAKEKWRLELEEEKDEAKKLAKMTNEEKELYEFKKQKEAFEKEKAQFEHNKLQVQTAKTLIEQGLPDLSAYITGKDAESTQANIGALNAVLGDWKQTIINDQLKGRAPKSHNAKKTYSRDELSSMTRDEINKAYEQGLIKL